MFCLCPYEVYFLNFISSLFEFSLCSITVHKCHVENLNVKVLLNYEVRLHSCQGEVLVTQPDKVSYRCSIVSSILAHSLNPPPPPPNCSSCYIHLAQVACDSKESEKWAYIRFLGVLDNVDCCTSCWVLFLARVNWWVSLVQIINNLFQHLSISASTYFHVHLFFFMLLGVFWSICSFYYSPSFILMFKDDWFLQIFIDFWSSYSLGFCSFEIKK